MWPHKVGPNFSLYLIKHGAMKMMEELKYNSILLTSALMEASGQLQARPAYPWKRTKGAYWIGEWMDPRASMDAVERRKLHLQCGKLIIPL
jgi:hypothetical protein